MKRFSYLLLGCLSVSVMACVAFAYLWIDRSISLTYLNQSYASERVSVRNLGFILQTEWRGMPEAQVLQRLQRVAEQMGTHQPVVKKEGFVIWFDQVPFHIKQGKLSGVGEDDG